jgi:dihydropteroate synthase
VDVGVEEELARLLPPLEAIRKALPDVNISVDTFRAEVARRALETGADIINDITAGRDLEMFSVVAGANAPYVMMHMRGTPQTMTGLTEYEHLILEIQHFFLERITFARAAGVGDIVLDPGLGFAKTIPQNFEILQNLEVFQSLGCPLLIGLSRKSMIWKTLKLTPDEALNGTTALHMAALMGGACILRVHDVKEAVETIKLFTTLVDVPV